MNETKTVQENFGQDQVAKIYAELDKMAARTTEGNVEDTSVSDKYHRPEGWTDDPETPVEMETIHVQTDEDVGGTPLPM